jgi:hypothetical protein
MARLHRHVNASEKPSVISTIAKATRQGICCFNRSNGLRENNASLTRFERQHHLEQNEMGIKIQ